MAKNKNNRKKGHKRAASHSAPPGYSGKKQTGNVQSGEQGGSFFQRHFMALKWVSLILMLGGFIAAYNFQLVVGYPLTIIGALIGFFTTRHDARMRKMSRFCYAAYIALIIVIWSNTAG